MGRSTSAPGEEALVTDVTKGRDQPASSDHPQAAGGDDGAPRGDTLAAIGELVLAWGSLEQTTAHKLAMMRQAFGDVRVVGGRARPTMPKLLAELRALVAMRDRHDKQALSAIAEIDGALQRITQVRTLVLEGAQACAGETVTCHDLKNMPHQVTRADIRSATAKLDHIREQIIAL